MKAVREGLEHIVFLENPRVLVSEWIPFGRNHMIAFNDELDSFHGIRGTLLTDRVDRSPRDSVFETSPILTEVTVRGFDPSKYVDFTARVFYPEVVEQEEEIGIHVEDSGLVQYGMELLEVGERKGVVPLDHISRVISDLVQDTSAAMDTLLSNFQRRVLDLVYFNRAKDRDKFAILVADDIRPRLKMAKAYQDGEDRENEINQIVKIAYDFRDLDRDSKLFIGTNGAILVCKRREECEPILSIYALTQSLATFQTNLFMMLWTLWDLVRETRRRLVEEGIRYVTEAQEELSKYQSDIVLIDNITGYMRETIKDIEKSWSELKKDVSKTGKKLAEILKIEKSMEMVEDRIADIGNIAEGLTNEIDGLNSFVGVLAEHVMAREARNIEYIAIFLGVAAIFAEIFYGTTLISVIALLAILLLMMRYMMRRRRAI